MRDLALLLGFSGMLLLGQAFRYPHVGVLLWCWAAVVVPNFYAYGFAALVPYNKIVAIITLAVWIFSKEPKKLPANTALVLMIIFCFWGTISALFALDRFDVVYREWDKFIKIIVFAIVVAVLMNTKARIEALLYALILSLGFHGVVSGAKFLASGGTSHIYGPSHSIIGDNNHFALAMIAMIPITLYVYRQTTSRVLQLVLAGSTLLMIMTIMGTFSRGGFLGISAVGALAFLRSRNKLRFALVVVPVLLLALTFAPERWSSRMDTIASADQDASFMGRVISWKQSTMIAIDNPVFGGGFFAVQDFPTWQEYSRQFYRMDFIPTDAPHPTKAFAAHSIYFQVLGDLGFGGLVIFLGILISSWRNASYIRRVARELPEMKWASDLATSLQYTMAAYMVSGAALNMAYFDLMYMIFGVLIAMRAQMNAQRSALPARPNVA